MAVIPSLNLFLQALLGLIFLVWVKRILWMRRFRKNHLPLPVFSESDFTEPKVSVIVPAKNEEKNIGNCLTHLLEQSYKNYEIIVVDDRSTDRTSEIVASFQKQNKVPIKLVRIEKLPPGWTGKNHAMQAGSKAASGDWLLFTDADTTHRPQSLRSSMACAFDKKIDFLTLAPEVESKSFWEKTVQPLAVASIALWFDPEKINDPKNPVALANGQFLLIRKEAYDKVGGSESVKMDVVEDVELAKKIRQAGYFVQFLNGTNLYSTRMYSNLNEIKTGWTRILTHLFNRSIPAIVHKIFLFFIFSIFPFLLLAKEIGFYFLTPQFFSMPVLVLSAALCLFIVLVRFIGSLQVKSNPWYSFLHPLGSCIMVWILSICVYRIAFNRASPWRGDLYK
jgi:chlorobactene glucosyltransferase